MSTLFSNSSTDNGYRLRYVEIFNWGTFDKHIHTLKPNSKTSLLTGSNGSGKTTIVDALLTLLVPPNKRFYNQSSGAESKKERDENSYFWGFYGKTYSELDERSKPEQLRNKSENPYSVLLGCFQNTSTQHTITLVQVRWFSNGGIQKKFIVAPYPFTIEEHFGQKHFDLRGEWKKKLVRQFPKTDIFDTFKEYAARFSDLFGLKEKALSLFNQTVGIKVLGDLTVFMRQQMLEEPNAEEQFKNLYDQYTDLLISHKAIQKDEQQLALLEPIVGKRAELLILYNQEQTLKLIDEQLPLFFENIEFDILTKEIDSLEERENQLKAQIKVITGEITALIEDVKLLVAQKAALNIDNRVQLLQKDIKTHTENRDRKRGIFEQYSALANNLGLLTEISENNFYDNKKRVTGISSDLDRQIEETNFKVFTDRTRLQNVAKSIEETQETINSYLGRKGRIKPELIRIRKNLAELLDTGEEELPFVGELSRVKDDSLFWENSIERVLRGFSLLLLVPERYNKRVNQYVYANDLKTKLTYQRIDPKDTTFVQWPRDKQSLANKVETKDSGLYSKWIEKNLVERFDYFCTDDLDIFYGSSKAITSNGLIRNVSRHEKDDRAGNWNKLDYTLGWDNKETVQLLIQEKRSFEKEHQELTSRVEQLSSDIRRKDEKRRALTSFAGIQEFSEINWPFHSGEIQQLQKQIEDLENSSDQYKTIVSQLDRVEQDLEGKNTIKEGYSKQLSTCEYELKNKNKRRLEILVKPITDDSITSVETFLHNAQCKTDVSTIYELDQLRKQSDNALRKQSGLTSQQIKSMEMSITNMVASFVNPNEHILKQFPDWTGDILNISPGLNSLNELEDLYLVIRNKRLVEHKRRFKEYMERSMLDALTSYKAWLENETDKIKEIIDELNTPLKKITFNKNPDTFLQLEWRPTKEQDIKIFREKLNATIPSAIEFATNKEDQYREQVFEKIKTLIEDLQKEEAWRRKVSDVRNWLNFSAREFSIAENKPGQYHDNTASYSGGQKAQFTYAILGAAIAHQFGIYPQGSQHKSLRFITVDEAFSKLDPEKSQFLMEFCNQLNLQILVVTPLDKINIVEDYISAVHYVEIKDKRNSILYNLTMEEYNERKEEFNQLAESAS